MLRRIVLLALALPASLFVTGCETTGDPHTGGIFWSETKARQRIDDREAHLNDVEDDTARVQRSNSRLRRRAAQDRAALGN